MPSGEATRASGKLPIVVAGATSGDAEPAELTRIFFQEIRVVGTTMGSRDDLQHLLAFLARTGVRPLPICSTD